MAGTTINDVAIISGLPQDGALVSAYLASRFSSRPAADAAPPDANPPDAGPVLSGVGFGGTGAFDLEVDFSVYYVGAAFGGHTAWKKYDMRRLAAVYDVKSFGAKGDCAMVRSEIIDVQGFATVISDAVMTSDNSGARVDTISAGQTGTTISDPSCVAADLGKQVSGTGFAVGCRVTGVTPGVSFAINQAAAATATTVTLSGDNQQLTSLSTTFDGRHLGMVVRVVGAQTAGAPMFSAITVITDVHTVKVNSTCQTTVVGASAVFGSGAMMTAASAGSGQLSDNHDMQDNNNAVFTGRHVGYVIRVVGAGAAGADLVTTIVGMRVPALGLFESLSVPSLAAACATDVVCASYSLGPGALSGLCNGSTTLRDSTNGAFSASDVGKRVLVIGGSPGSGVGPGGNDLLTTIASVTNSTTVVLASAAYTPTGSGRTAGINLNSYIVTDTAATAADVGKLVSGTGFGTLSTSTTVILSFSANVDGAGNAGYVVSNPPTVSGAAAAITLTPLNAYMFSRGGAVTAGSSLLNDPGAAFTAADVGKLITVRNGAQTTGWGQTPAGTTVYTGTGSQITHNINMNTLLAQIKAVNSPTQVQLGDRVSNAALSATSTSFCSSYAFGHDDTKAISDCLVAAQAAGGGVASLEQPGLYGLVTPLAMLAGAVMATATGTPLVSTAAFSLRGGGQRASGLLMLTPPDGTQGNGMLHVKDVEGVEVEGVNFEGNLLATRLLAITSSFVRVRRPYVHGNRFTEASQSNSAQWSIQFNANHNFLLQDVDFSHNLLSNIPTTHQDVISADQCDGVSMLGNVLEDVNQSVFSFGSVRTQFEANLCRWVLGRGGNGFNMDAYDGAYIGNDFQNCDPVQLGGQTQSGRIIGNNFFDTALVINSQSDQLFDIVIKGNTVTIPPVSRAGNTLWSLSTVFGLVMEGNDFSVASNPSRVVYLKGVQAGGSTCGDIVIKGNVFNTAVTGGNIILNLTVEPLAEPRLLAGSTMGDNDSLIEAAAGSFQLDAGSGGTVSYVADTLTDTAKAWAVNQWLGGTVVVGGQSQLVISNTATTIQAANAWSPLPGAGTAYSVDDSGKQILVPGAGRGKAPMVTKIKTVLSATQAILKNKAAQTVTGVTAQSGAVGGALVEGNVFDAVNSGGIGLILNASSTEVSGNIFRGLSGGTAIQDNGIVAAPAGNNVHDNKVVNGAVVRAASSTWRNNTGVNPVGPQVVAVPASGVASASVGVDCMVYVTNPDTGVRSLTLVISGPGGATSITVSVPAQGAAPVFVPAHSTLTPTYSLAPTWVWQGL